MNKEEFKLKLVDVFVEERSKRLPVIDDDFIARYKEEFFEQIVRSCSAQLSSGYKWFGINYYFVSNRVVGYLEQYVGDVYEEMYPRILEWLKDYDIPYELDGEPPMIKIQIKDLERLSNVDNLAALK